jgi:transposase
MRKPYLTDLSDAEWTYLEGCLLTAEYYGQPRVHSFCDILKVIFYVVRSGCFWRLLHHDFPPWQTVYNYSGDRRLSRIWEVQGRKRHLLVDAQELVLRAKVDGANIQDREGIKLLLEPARTGLTRHSHLWLDAGYTGQDKAVGCVRRALGWTAKIVCHPPKPAPEEVERLCETSEAFAYVVMSRPMVRRLARR